MRRRDLLRAGACAGFAAAAAPWRWALARPGARAPEAAGLADQLPPPLRPEVFERRIREAQALLARNRIDVLFAEPGSNFEYLAGATFGRSERLVALLLPRSGEPVIVAPAFEVERIRRAVHVGRVEGWEEAQDPYALVAALVRKMPRRLRRIGIEESTRYDVLYRLGQALPDWIAVPGRPILRAMRIRKSPEEVALLRRAVEITEAAIAATFARLDVGMTDREAAEILDAEFSRRGVRGGGLVQFGPTSALPHGGTEGRRLELGMPVLIDAGCRVHGYTSDITRMHYFGHSPPDRYVEVYNTVLGAQTAAMEIARPGAACQDLDRAARRVIEAAGYGPLFTHRLGHGIGLDGHEDPYLVEGNAETLEPGMTFTIEPGIYLPEEWGVRIEDDVVVTETGIETLSTRPSALG
jgi:Xaa-Pro dipeptidase